MPNSTTHAAKSFARYCLNEGHALIARSKILSQGYLTMLGGLMRLTPKFPFKANIVASIVQCRWPQMNFGSRTVEVCPSIEIEIFPHVGEQDFKALLTESLNYELDVFRLLKDRLKQYDAILEIGANVGLYSCFFANYRPNKQVPLYCFEPSKTAFCRLVRNMDLADQTNVYLVPAAVSTQSGLVRFFEPVEHLSNGSIIENFAACFSSHIISSWVPCVGPNEITQLLSLSHAPLLKIDVEGSEPEVITALAEFIKIKLPDIIMEVLLPYAENLNNISVILENYNLYLITPDGLMEKTAFEAHPLHRDYFLSPKNRSVSA